MSKETFLSKAAGNHSTVAHDRAPRQEKAWAKKGSGRLTPGSGNKAVKGDVRKYRKVVRLECKTTRAGSFSVSRKMFEKLQESALPHDEIPAIVVEFLSESGKPLHELAIVPTYVLDAIGEYDDG